MLGYNHNPSNQHWNDKEQQLARANAKIAEKN